MMHVADSSLLAFPAKREVKENKACCFRMSDWRFASISGYLTWTSPSLPDGGTELFSELSPTLIIGLQEQGDVLPVDYIKISTITSITLSPGGRLIELTRADGSPIALVAPTPAEAQEWHKNIQAAVGDATTASHVKPPSSRGSPTPPTATPIAQAAAATGGSNMTSADGAPFAPEAGDAAGVRAGSAVSASSLSRLANLSPAQQPSAGSGSRPGSETGSLKLQTAARSLGEQPSALPFGWKNTAPTNLPAPAPIHPAAAAACDTGSHDFRPLSDFVGAGFSAAAKTTTITTHVDAQRAAGQRYTSATLPSAPSAVKAPAAPSGAPQSAAPVWTPLSKSQLQASPLPPQPTPTSSLQLGGVSRPMPTQKSMTTSVPQQSVSPIAPYEESQFRYPSHGATDTSADHTSTGFRKRSGMLVDVPANPQVNRNIAPNVSAIWKEWKGPDGVVYVCHEPTGTLQRLNAETGEFETLVDGNDDIDPNDMALRPYSGNETAVDLNNNLVKNLTQYGGHRVGGATINEAVSPSVYRTAPVTSPRGQYSPTRRSQLAPLAEPRTSQSHYNGRRVHHLQLGLDADETTIEHSIQLLGGNGIRWDPSSGQVVAPSGHTQADVGASTLHRQWEHVRRILMQGRYFKKHALRTTTTSFRFVFLTSDNAYVVCVPTSDVLFHVNEPQKTFSTMADTIQYYGPESRAIALNTITHVSLGVDEPFVRSRASQLTPENTFCIVSRSHAFILECNTSEEAKYFADAWTFFLYHSKPVSGKQQKTPQMKKPVTFGTRAGLAF